MNAYPYYDPQDGEKGIELLQKGAVRTIILAGGVGSRLGFPHPKGMFPITPISKKSLFQLFAEKTLACSRLVKNELSLAIMTSEENDAETRHFFKSHHNFGLGCIDFFIQKSLPYLDEKGSAMPFFGPAGNGALFEALHTSGLLEKWEEEGVTILHIVLVDNALADPFDPFLIGHIAREKSDIALKVCRRKNPNLAVGVLVEERGKLSVIEYSELPESEKNALSPDGTFKHPFFNLSLMAFTLNFANTIAKQTLPLHRSFKSIPGTSLKGWKQETFLFDALLFSSKTTLLEAPEEVTFAPLKAKEGEGSPEEVQRKIAAHERALYFSITGEGPPKEPFELAPDYYYKCFKKRGSESS